MLQPLYFMYCCLATVFIWLAAYFTVAILSIGSDRKGFNYYITSRIMARLIIRSTGIRIKVIGMENIKKNEPVIFVSNHQSLLDIILAMAFIPNNFSFISKESLFKFPILGNFMRTAGHISLKREAGKKAYDTMVDTVNKLNTGKSLVLFPEGTRSIDGKLGTFKRGVSLLVVQAQNKVVPMAIIGSSSFLPKNGIYCNMKKRDITFKFGKPLTFAKNEKPDRQEINNIVSDLHNAVSELIIN